MLKTLVAALCAPLLLVSCAPMAGTPTELANTTIVDERAALGVETLYKGWVAMVDTALDLDLLRGERAARVEALDKDIYAAVQVARQAYDAGNAASYADATARVTALIATASALIQGDRT